MAQYAELLDTQEQVEEQINLEPAPSDTPNTDVCLPIFTLFVDDDNTKDESADADVSVDNIGPTKVNGEITILSNDSDGDIESKVDTTQDDGPQVYVNDPEISIEENTSIEIRGPPLSETGLDSLLIAHSDTSFTRDFSLLVDVSAEANQTGDLEDKGIATVSGTSEVGQQALELFSVSPALFVENQGQWSDPSVRYVHDGSFADVAITDSGVIFQITRSEPKEGDNESDSTTKFDQDWPVEPLDLEQADTRLLQFSASFVGADEVQPMGLECSQTLFNYILGDQANWRENVTSYQLVAYQDLYEGIDLRLWGLRSHLKYEFQVAPGADWSQISIRYDGIEGLSIAEDGSLSVDLGPDWGVMYDDAPYIYQEIDGVKVPVSGRFVVLDNQTYTLVISM